MDNQPQFPKRLKEARLRIGISQKELGIRAGINEFGASTRMNQYEKGVHAPSYLTAERIAKQLGVPSCYLYCAEDEVATLLLRYSKLNAVERKRLLKHLEQNEKKSR